MTTLKWSCRTCGSKTKPSGMANPTQCRNCTGKAIKEGRKTYPKICTDCSEPFESKATNAKYCPSCRQNRQLAFKENVSKKTRDCLMCHTSIPLEYNKFYCNDCGKANNQAFQELKASLGADCIVTVFKGKPRILKVYRTADNFVELKKLIEDV